jgi:thioredoxin 1
MVRKVNDAEFSEILQKENKIIVKYFANWCGNCRLFSPKFQRMSDKAEYEGITFLDVNAEENPDARRLGGVSNLPFFATFVNGKLHKGDSSSKEEFVENMIKEIL